MSKQDVTVSCPTCGTEITPAQLFTDEAARRAFARLAAVSIPLGARIMGYVNLFSPPKTRLTIAKQVKLILQLLPDLERQAITHKGREWAAPLPAWEAAFEQMEAARAAGKLDLPMTGHGYLYAIVAGHADKHEARQEAQREADLRAGRDPALARAEHAARQAAPMPEALRELQARLKRGGGEP